MGGLLHAHDGSLPVPGPLARAPSVPFSDSTSSRSEDGDSVDSPGYYTHMLLHAMTFVNPPVAAAEFGVGSWRAMRHACACRTARHSSSVMERSKFAARQSARRLADALDFGAVPASDGATGSLLAPGLGRQSSVPAAMASAEGDGGDGDDDSDGGAPEPCCVLWRVKCRACTARYGCCLPRPCRRRCGDGSSGLGTVSVTDAALRTPSPAHLASRLQITTQPPDVAVEQFSLFTVGDNLLLTMRAGGERPPAHATNARGGRRTTIDDTRILSILFHGLRRRLRCYNDASGYLFTGSVRALACDILDAVTQYNFGVRDALKGTAPIACPARGTH